MPSYYGGGGSCTDSSSTEAKENDEISDTHEPAENFPEDTTDVIPFENFIDPIEEDYSLPDIKLDSSLLATEKQKFPVVFSEVYPNNYSLKDFEGGDAGWVELFNTADTLVNLAGMVLTDEQTEPTKWTFGEIEIEPHAYIVVFLSGKNVVKNLSDSTCTEDCKKFELHANFKLEKEGGALYLFNAKGKIVDFVIYPKLPTGKSWAQGTSAEGDTIWGFGTPSPYEKESEIIENSIAEKSETSFPHSGFYTKAFTVEIPKEKSMRCAFGGFEPDKDSSLITSLKIDTTMVLKCRSYEDGKMPSEVLNRTYIFEKAPALPAFFITANPLSLFDPDSGIYSKGNNASEEPPFFGANYWLDKELPAFVEFHEIAGGGFAKNAGIKIVGGWSRAKKKKSIAVTFREKYGENRLHYALFPDYPHFNKFKTFMLRNTGNSFGHDYIRDRLASSITEGLGIDYQLGRSTVVFYNGEYYGIHNLRDRSTEYYFETHYGYDPEKIDLLKATNSVTSGSAKDYKDLIAWLEGVSLTEKENYDSLKNVIDVGNFINYLHAGIFADNRDWIQNNLKKWRLTDPVTKWKWFMYDNDYGFDSGYGSSTLNIFDFVTSTTPSKPGPQYTFLLRKCLENEEFTNMFINRMAILLSMNFKTERVLKRIDELMDEVEGEMASDQKRWNFDAAKMKSHLTRIKNFAKSRPAKVRSEMEKFFDLPESVVMKFSVDGHGAILIDGLKLDEKKMELKLYPTVPMTLSVQSLGGNFVGWSDGENKTERIVTPKSGLEFKAIFK